MDTIRVFEAFAGYGSQHLALKRLKRDYPNFDYEVVGISEIHKYAIQAYNALHPNVTNYGDISKIDWSQVPDFDLFTYSFPCQDISNAGLQRGFEEGSETRSSLLWECLKAIVAKRPKYLLLENVKALVSKKFLPMFNKWIKSLEDYGYYNNWSVLNTKDFGVPQNRERVFLMSIRRDLLDPNPVYNFPKPFPLEIRLKDVLEEKVDEKYYLSDKIVEGFTRQKQDPLNPYQGGGIKNNQGTIPTK
jgi:DNA (cytosine-5)-methyltransferase 1